MALISFICCIAFAMRFHAHLAFFNLTLFSFQGTPGFLSAGFPLQLALSRSYILTHFFTACQAFFCFLSAAFRRLSNNNTTSKVQLLLSRVFIIPFFRSNVNKYSRNLEYFARIFIVILAKYNVSSGASNKPAYTVILDNIAFDQLHKSYSLRCQ
ncbi:MAG: hypothetical protein H6Q66_1264 [Firmicutes bacterium]|nr:hypothetical protein [Bacillota bacterium]